MPIYKNINLNKTEISEKSRKILIDWIISVHAKFNLLPNTLFLTINLIDRIIEKNVAYINSFQLLGTTALHIAAKYEEIYPPEINDYIFISNKAFSKEDVIEMEIFILDKLNFDILCISPYVFLDRLYFISRENNIDVYYLTSMFIEFSFLSIEIMKNKQSLIAASMFYLALKFIYPKKNKVWNNKLQIHTGYKEHKIKSVIKDFILFFKGNIRDKKNKINSLFIKYNHDKFGNVSEKYLGNYK
jgi:cyclin B